MKMTVPPWIRQRFHYNWNGNPKIVYSSYDNALAAAKDVNRKRLYTDEKLAEPYICKLCGKWHIGRSKQAHKDTTLWHEIGDRAYYNLISENNRSPAMRMFSIFTRFKFLDVNYGNKRFQLLRLKTRAETAPKGAPERRSKALDSGKWGKDADDSEQLSDQGIRDRRPLIAP